MGSQRVGKQLSDLARQASVDLAPGSPPASQIALIKLPGLLQPGSSHRPSLTVFLFEEVRDLE